MHKDLHRQRRGSARLRRFFWCALFLISLFAGFQTGQGAHLYLERLFAPQQGVSALLPLVEGWSLPGMPREGNPPLLPQWGGEERVNILVLGTDRRQKEERAVRSDVIMVVSLDPVAQRAVVLSIPRDLWVSIPGWGESRINTAYFYGELMGSGGAALAAETVQANLGIPIHHWLHLDFDGFRRIVDIMGGVTIDVPAPILDDMFPDDDYGYTSIYIPAGEQLMDGETLLKYARTRHGGNDFHRIRRQQQALRALAEKAMGLDLLPRLPELLTTLLDTVSTDLEPLEILALANLAQEIGMEGVEMRAIDETLTFPFVTWDDAQILLPDKEGIERLVEELFASSPTSAGEERSEEVGIAILNGTGEAGVAAAVADLLHRRGYEVERYGDVEGLEETAVASSEEAMEVAHQVAGLLGIDEVTSVSFSDQGASITILLGPGFSLP